MLEYLSVHHLPFIARVYQRECQQLTGVEDPYRYYIIASIADDLSTTHGKPNFHWSLPYGKLRIEVAPYPVRARDWIFPGEYVEFFGMYTEQRLTFLLSALAGLYNGHQAFSHFTMIYGSTTLYAHCD